MTCQQVDYQIQEAAEVAPPNMWSSIPCPSGSPWQYLNLHKGGHAFRAKLNRQILASKRLFAIYRKRAELVLSLGGTVTSNGLDSVLHGSARTLPNSSMNIQNSCQWILMDAP